MPPFSSDPSRRPLEHRPPDDVLRAARPLGLPVGHVLHPGDGWVRRRVPGGALELGLGLVGLDPARPEVVVAAGPREFAVAGDPVPAWSAALAYLDRMAALAVARWQRNPGAPLRPMGDCDVVTLLAAPVFRSALAARAGGMCPAAVPMRRRGWTDLRRLDPAFAAAAAAATDAADRGFGGPVLITADEVVLAREGGPLALIDLRDPAPPTPVRPGSRYR